MKFIDRQDELKRLKRALAQPQAALLVVYGRRRCGKSTLLQKMLHPEKDVYYLASQEDSAIQRTALAREIGRQIPHFESAEYTSWSALFETLNERCRSRINLFIDEFPYLVQTAPELPSVIQRYWDSPAKRRFSLILCGSSQRMMQGLVLDHSAPLYGRAREIMKITPLSAGWIQDGLNMEPDDAVKAYAVWGGVPRYWELAAKHRSTDAAVAHLLLDRHGVLFNEPLRLLLDDMRGAVQAVSLLTLIGYGCHRMSEIAARLGKPAGSLVRPLGHLIELGYVKRDYPFGDSPRSSKRTLYKLEDPFLRFYFKFIEPQRSRIELGLGRRIAREIKAGEALHVADVWEDLARSAVPYLTAGGLQWQTGSRWWGAGTDKQRLEIDVMAEAVDGSAVLVGEAKWGAAAGDYAKLKAQLLQKAARCPLTAGRKIVTALWLGNRTVAIKAKNDVFTAAETMKALRRG